MAADCLGPKVGGCPALFYIRQMNQVNSRNGSAMMTAPYTLSYLLLLCYYMPHCGNQRRPTRRRWPRRRLSRVRSRLKPVGCTIDDDVRGVHCAEKTTRLINKQRYSYSRQLSVYKLSLTTLRALIILINLAYLALLRAESHFKAELCLILRAKTVSSPESHAL